jgi:isopentenyl diphosphate isomerase/L-lactate dehydrogenase-like FMN-dependent dehydrogenase
VAEATAQNHRFQLYPAGDPEFVGRLIDRARGVGYTALFLTVDVPVAGNREDERLAGMRVPIRLNTSRILNMAWHPREMFGTARHGRVVPASLLSSRTPAGEARNSVRRVGAQLAEAASPQPRILQSELNWDDLDWIRDQWKGLLWSL